MTVTCVEEPSQYVSAGVGMHMKEIYWTLNLIGFYSGTFMAYRLLALGKKSLPSPPYSALAHCAWQDTVFMMHKEALNLRWHGNFF